MTQQKLYKSNDTDIVLLMYNVCCLDFLMKEFNLIFFLFEMKILIKPTTGPKSIAYYRKLIGKQLKGKTCSHKRIDKTNLLWLQVCNCQSILSMVYYCLDYTPIYLHWSLFMIESESNAKDRRGQGCHFTHSHCLQYLEN